MSRDDKLDALNKKRSVKDAERKDIISEFINNFSEKVDELKDSLGLGVEIKNIDDMVEQLSVLQSFQGEVKDLKTSIENLKLPSKIEIKGVDSLLKAAQEISKQKAPIVEKIDISVLNQVVDGVAALVSKVEELKAPEPGQAPSDYVPMRRVMLVGKQLMYDDSFYTGGGGGSSSSASSGGSTDVSALALENGGNLAAIKTDVDKIPSQGQALAAASMPVVLPAAQVTTLTPPAAITGFATSANQTTANSSLSSIDGKITAVNTGSVTVVSAPTTAVTGTFWQTTQPVSLATAPTTPVTGTFWQSTQPVSLAANTPTLQASTAVIGHVIVDSGAITANATTPTTVRYGQVTVAVTNTAVVLTTQACAGVVVQALAANAGNVVIGDSSVTTANGFQLQPGQSTGVSIDNVNKLYVNGTSGDGVCWIGS